MEERDFMKKEFFGHCDSGNFGPKVIYSDSVPIGIVELKYTDDKLLIQDANSDFYVTAECVDEDFYKVYGNNYRGIIVDEDWERLKEQMLSVIDGKQDRFSCEYRVRFKGKKIFWRKINAVKSAEDLEGVMFLCALTDITDVKMVQTELEKERESFYTIASLSNTKLFEYKFHNDTLYDITGGKINKYLENFSVKIHDYDIFSKDGENYGEKVANILKSGNKRLYTEFKINQFGREEWHGLWGKTIFDKNGVPLRVIGKTQNINYEKRSEEFFSNVRHIDNLTGIYIGEYAKKLIGEVFNELSEKNHAVIVLDIDDFAELNNNLGKKLCDQVLSNVSRRIKNVLDEKDIIGRLGGDEFIIFIDDALSEERLEVLLDKVNFIVESTYSGERYKNCIKGSVGAVISKPGDRDFEKNFEKADYALYIAKSMGKNKSYIFSEKDEEPFLNRVRKASSDDEKFAYQKEIYAEREFNYEIAEFAFDVMESTQDVDSAVNILLDKVGIYFNLSRIVIRELEREREKYLVSYQWFREPLCPVDNLIDASDDNIKRLMSDNNNGDAFEYSEYPGFERGKEYRKCVEGESKSEVRFRIRKDGEFKGYISFCDSSVRIWGQNEIRALKMIGKIISAYLLKMRAFKEAEKTVWRLTRYDSVTGVMRYDTFKTEVEKILKEDTEGDYAIVYSDIRNFKYINEKYGYRQGDGILKDFVAGMDLKKYSFMINGRVFSDNFVSLIKLDDKITKENIGEHIDQYDRGFATKKESELDEIKINVISGIYIIEKGSDEIDKEYVNRIIDKANTARKYGKGTHSGRAVFFDSNMESRMRKQTEILTSMERALMNNEFVIVLQPKVELKGEHKIVGAEALVRWIRDDGRVIQPIDFIPLFEQNGFVVNVDFCVYEQVCKFLSKRIKEGKRVVPVSVNVSRVHLEKDDFMEKIENLISKYQIPRNLLEFELTENVFLENSDKAIQVMNKLKKMQFKVSMDDFGSGFSSLNLLKKLPVDILKMDKGFLDTDEIKGNDEVVIKSIIDMAKKMSITVLCEGVETQKQAMFLQNAGCDLAQGYYFSKPVMVEQFDEML